MKPAVHRWASLALLGWILLPISVVHATSPPPDSLQSCLVHDFELQGLDVHAAGKPLAGLNVGEPRTVRMFYFLPNDRPFREEVVQKMKDEIRLIQAFYGEQMHAQGYGYRTFRYETDEEGEPLVHRVDGQHPDSHYDDETFRETYEEIVQTFDLSKNINVLVIDNVSDRISRDAWGRAVRWSKESGVAIVAAGAPWQTMAHELGHVFGLAHNFYDDAYIMSYGQTYREVLSACAAEHLAVHPYLNPEVGLVGGQPPTIELISSRAYPAGSESVPVRLRVGDADGLHQARLIVPTKRTPRIDPGGLELKTCQGLTGEKERVVEFAYDGEIPSGAIYGLYDLSDPPVHSIHVRATDQDGNTSLLHFHLWEVSPQHVSTLEAGQVHSLAFAPDGTLASASADAIRLWDLDRRTATTLSRGTNALALSPGSAILAAGSRDIALWNPATGQFLASLQGSGSRTRSVAFAPDGTVLAAAYLDEIQLWDMTTRTRTSTLPAGATAVAISADGLLAAADGDQITLWDLATLASTAVVRHTWNTRGDPEVSAVAFSPDGRILASGSDDETVRLWDASTGESVSVLRGHGLPVSSVVFSPDGTLLASGARRGEVKLWDVDAGHTLATLRAPSQGANTLAFSPDGRVLAAASDGTIELWDMAEWLQPRPKGLVVISGDNQQGPAGAELDEPLILEVRDQYDNPLPGVEVTFAVTEGDGHLGDRFTLRKMTSDGRGRTEVILTLGPGPGSIEVEATVPGLEALTFAAVGIGGSPLPGMEVDFPTWHLPNDALIRLGKGRFLPYDRVVAFSPDGRSLAVLSEIGLWLYDVATFRPRALVAPDEQSTPSMAFSPDGTMIAMGGHRIHLWELAAGINSATILDHPGWASSLAFLADGTLVAAGSNHVSSWDMATGTNIAVTPLDLGNREAISPDGSVLASDGGDHTIQLWDLATGTKTATLKGHKEEIRSLDFSPDGSILASGSRDYTVKLWDVAEAAHIATLEGHTSWVESVTFARDGMTLASGSFDGTVRLWDPATAANLFTSETRSPVRSVAFSPDGRTVASASSTSSEGTVMLWDVESGSAAPLAQGHRGWVSSVALSPDGKTAVSAYQTGRMELWDLTTGTIAATLEGHTQRLNTVAFSHDGTTLASGGSDQAIKIWDLATGTSRITLESHEPRSWVNVVAFSPDGTKIGSGHGNGTVKVWNTVTGNSPLILDGHTDQVKTVAFSPDGTTLASGASDQAIKIWDLATGKGTAALELPTESVLAVAFSPDGTPLASGRRGDRAVEVWNVATATRIATLIHDQTHALTAAFSPDGRRFVFAGTTLSNTSSVELWDIGTQKNIASLEEMGEITSVAFSLERPIFASGSTAGTVMVWDMGRIMGRFLPYPKSLTKVSGDEQDGRPGLVLDNPFVIKVWDQNTYSYRGAEVTFAIVSGDGALSVESTTTNHRGQASTTLTLGSAPGPITVEVTVAGLDPVTFTATTLAIPWSLTRVSGLEQEEPAGEPLQSPLVVSVLDQAGSPLPGALVTFTLTDGQGTLSASSVTTDSNGLASTTLTLGRQPGANTVVVTVAGLDPVTFTATGLAVPRTLTKVSGDLQHGTIGTQLADPLAVSVHDQTGSPLPGALVTFTLTDGQGSLSSTTDTTDAAGLASITLTLGEEPGASTVEVAVAGLDPVTFTATARPSPDFDGDGVTGFSDFFLFAEAFGSSDPRFDLDASGSVDFADFFLFSESFGQPQRAKLLALAAKLIGLPEGPQLRQNAPNPFNSQTVISYFLLAPGPARLEVYSLTGQRVAVLHRGTQQAGLHRIQWDARDEEGRPLASGIYLYRLEMEKVARTRKLVLLR